MAPVTFRPRRRSSTLPPSNTPQHPIGRLDDYVNAGRVSRLLRRAPVTTQLVFPYALLIVPQAVLNANPHLDFIIGVFGLGLVGALAVEIFARPRRWAPNLESSFRHLANYGGVLRLTAILACVVGQVSAVSAASLGAGTVAAQLGISRTAPPLASALSIFSTWTYSGAALMVGAFLAGQVSKRSLHIWFLAILALEAYRASITTITASLVSLAIYLVVLAIFAGTLKWYHCAIVVVLVLLVWPTVYDLRNEFRRDSGVKVSTSVDAYQRLRYDEQITRAAAIPNVPIEIGQPNAEDIFRYGLVPRVLDPDRPNLSTGSKINAFLGGSASSSFTFLPLTTLYVLEGATRTIAFYAVLAVVLLLTLRGGTFLTPTRLVIFGLISSGPLDWFAGYPDSTIGALQGMVAAVPLLLLLHAFRGRPSNP